MVQSSTCRLYQDVQWSFICSRPTILPIVHVGRAICSCSWCDCCRLGFDKRYVVVTPALLVGEQHCIFWTSGSCCNTYKSFLDHKLAPLYLLVWATYYVTSTAVCYVELVATKDWPTEHIAGLKPSYLIFGLVGESTRSENISVSMQDMYWHTQVWVSCLIHSTGSRMSCSGRRRVPKTSI